MSRAVGYCLFDTPLGWCGIAWGDAMLAGVQLPETSEAATRSRMQRRFAGLAESAPPEFAAIAIDRWATRAGLRWAMPRR